MIIYICIYFLILMNEYCSFFSLTSTNNNSIHSLDFSTISHGSMHGVLILSLARLLDLVPRPQGGLLRLIVTLWSGF